MPLSEHEQRLLDQIERALYAEDPKFASTVRSTDLRTHMRRRLRRAGYLFGVGVVLLIAGVATHVAVGVAGFVVMLLAFILALSAYRRLGSGGTTTLRSVGGTAAPRPTRDRSSVRDRLEERWKRRWDERGQGQ